MAKSHKSFSMGESVFVKRTTWGAYELGEYSIEDPTCHGWHFVIVKSERAYVPTRRIQKRDAKGLPVSPTHPKR